MLGRYAGSSEIGRRSTRMADPFSVSEYPCMVALRSGQPVQDVRMGVLHPNDKQHRWLLVSAHPLFDQGGSKP